MKIVIKIPKEFEEHFKSDRFEDSLSRVASDIESFGFQLAGRYEKETITMLREAIKNGTPLPEHHGNLIDVNVLKNNIHYVPLAPIFQGDYVTYRNVIFADILDMLPTIIEGSDSE